jgi:predicted nucleotidyltransferase
MDAATSHEPHIPIDSERIAALCRKWKIVEFALFGSVLTDEFRPDSDVDVLLEFAPTAAHQGDEMLEIHAELEKMFGPKVDLVQKNT